MLSLTDPEQVRAHFTASLALSVVRLTPAAARDPLSIGDAEYLAAMRAIVSDVTLTSHPPLCAVADLLSILFHRDEVVVAPDGLDPELARQYRLGAVLPWLRDDPSLEKLAPIAQSRRGQARSRFLPFVAREIGRALGNLCRFPIRVDCPRLPEPAFCRGTMLDRAALELERGALHALIDGWRGARRLLTVEQVSRLTYVREEADLEPLREYDGVSLRLRPASLRTVQRTRSARYQQCEVHDDRSPAMGGYSGLHSGGSLEQIHALLPSELAQMETGKKPDLFDLNLLEKRLLYFQRDQRIDIRRRRLFHVLLWAPAKLDYRPQIVPVRWPYLFLGVVLDVVRFFRDALTITNCPFCFVFHGNSAGNGRYERLIGAIRDQDLREVPIDCRRLEPGELAGYLEGAMRESNDAHVVLSVAERGCPCDAELPLGIGHVRVEFTTAAGVDSVVLDDGTTRHELIIFDERSLCTELNRLRDLLAIALVGARVNERN